MALVPWNLLGQSRSLKMAELIIYSVSQKCISRNLEFLVQLLNAKLICHLTIGMFLHYITQQNDELSQRDRARFASLNILL